LYKSYLPSWTMLIFPQDNFYRNGLEWRTFSSREIESKDAAGCRKNS
jgi:hypothetical protein